MMPIHWTATDMFVLSYIAMALAVGAVIGAVAVLIARDARPEQATDWDIGKDRP